MFGTLTADVFVDSARKITNTVVDIPESILKMNYMNFLVVLENHTQNKEKGTFGSKDLIRDFLDSKLKLFTGIEITIQSICAAAVKVSVESDVESLVSRYEKHLKVDRQLEEEAAEEEMEISENGPILAKADKIVNKAMKKYRKANGSGECHFIRKKSQGTFFKSKVLDRLKNEPSRLGFMDS